MTTLMIKSYQNRVKHISNNMNNLTFTYISLHSPIHQCEININPIMSSFHKPRKIYDDWAWKRYTAISYKLIKLGNGRCFEWSRSFSTFCEFIIKQHNWCNSFLLYLKLTPWQLKCWVFSSVWDGGQVILMVHYVTS